MVVLTRFLGSIVVITVIFLFEFLYASLTLPMSLIFLFFPYMLSVSTL